jgi:hypothetical protein
MNRFRRGTFPLATGDATMGEPKADKKDLPSDDESIEREGEKNQKEMDQVPPPGTDPLHEGP